MTEEMPARFIAEPIMVEFDTPPQREKKPHCPNRFVWEENTYHIRTMISEWQDYKRRGRMARNMQPQHITRARQTGSWGVGRFYFKVKTSEGRIFDIYYDRAPKSSDQRKGAWFLYREWLSK